MTRFEVDASQVAAAGAAALASVAVLGSEVDLLTRRLTDLGNTWKGASASQFQAISHDWRTTAEAVKAALEQISQALAVTATTYEDAEAAAMRMFAR